MGFVQSKLFIVQTPFYSFTSVRLLYAIFFTSLCKFFASLEILLHLLTRLFPRACKSLYAAPIVRLFYLLFCLLCALILRSFFVMFKTNVGSLLKRIETP